MKPFFDANSKKAREDTCAGRVQAPTAKRSLCSPAGWKLLRRATEIPPFECDSACQSAWTQVSPVSSRHHSSAKCLLYFLSSVPYCGKSLDDGDWACANQTSVRVIHRSLCAATATHLEQTQNSTVIPGFPDAHTRLLSSSSGWGGRSLGVFPASFWARHSASSDFTCWKTLCPRSTMQPDARLWVTLSSSVCRQLLLPGDKGAFCSGLIHSQVSVRESSSWTWLCRSSLLILSHAGFEGDDQTLQESNYFWLRDWAQWILALIWSGDRHTYHSCHLTHVSSLN